jgi:hypothetical protein
MHGCVLQVGAIELDVLRNAVDDDIVFLWLIHADAADLTNSAVMPSTFIELIFSTSAGGKVFSIPNKKPIFFIAPP